MKLINSIPFIEAQLPIFPMSYYLFDNSIPFKKALTELLTKPDIFKTYTERGRMKKDFTNIKRISNNLRICKWKDSYVIYWEDDGEYNLI